MTFGIIVIVINRYQWGYSSSLLSFVVIVIVIFHHFFHHFKFQQACAVTKGWLKYTNTHFEIVFNHSWFELLTYFSNKINDKYLFTFIHLWTHLFKYLTFYKNIHFPSFASFFETIQTDWGRQHVMFVGKWHAVISCPNYLKDI